MYGGMRRAKSQFSRHLSTRYRLQKENCDPIPRKTTQPRTHPQSPASELMSRGHRIVDSGDTGVSGEGGGGIAVFFAGSAPVDVFKTIVVAAAALQGKGRGGRSADEGRRDLPALHCTGAVDDPTW